MAAHTLRPHPTANRHPVWLVLRAAADAAALRETLIWGLISMAVLCAIPSVWLAVWRNDGDAAARTLRFLGVLCADITWAGLWLFLLQGLLKQNQPTLARLVPGHTAALRRAVVLLAVGVLALALLTHAWAGHALSVVTFVALVGMAGSAALLRWAVLRGPATVLGWTGAWWGQQLSKDHVREALAAAWNAHQNTAVAASALLLVAVLWLSVQGGGRTHRQQRQKAAERDRRWGGRSSVGVSGARQPAPWLTNTATLLLRHTPLLRRWSLEAISARPRHPIAGRLALGLGPQGHVGGLVVHQIVGMLFGLVVLTVVAWALDNPKLQRLWVFGAAAALAMTSVGSPLTLQTAMRSTAREQALLRLLPGCPNGPALNQLLSRHHARLVLGTLAVFGGGGVLLMAALVDHFPPPPVLQAAACVLPLWPWMLVGLWRDWSATPRLGNDGGFDLTLTLPWLVLPLPFVWVLGWGWPWWALVALSTALLLPVLRWRWQLLSGSRTAWPMGRWPSGT